MASRMCFGKLSGTHSCCGEWHAYTVNPSPDELPVATAVAAAPPAAAAAAADPPALGNVLSFGRVC